mgnify:CR=1 FL=1|jgi:PKHD-type hydroxylase|tara:strand:- start:9 stop:578 length:570 start_codon:yes stop_codon:yes gene_type:complete
MWYLTGATNEAYVSSTESFSKQELDAIIQIFDDGKLKDGIAVDPTSPDVRKSKIGWVDNFNPDLEWLYRKLTDLTMEVNNNFFNYDLVSLEPLQLTEYSEDYEGQYKKHIDYGRTTSINRKLSFTLQLSDSLEYEGGDLLLHTSEEPLIMNKERGAISFFPSFTLHEVTPVTKGMRRSLVGWVSGPRFR